ncbi:MAG: hypothetical protein V4714_00365 [Bacteroidota bacterium]
MVFEDFIGSIGASCNWTCVITGGSDGAIRTYLGCSYKQEAPLEQ